MIRIGVVGYGYWGPNIVRNFNSANGSKVVAICDKDPQMLVHIANEHPGIRAVSSYDEIVTSTDIDAVAIATSVSTHYELARKALENGKHAFVEKPFTATTAEAASLIEIAEQKHLKIMVDHTFLFTGAIRKIKDLIDNRDLGKIYYYDSTRFSLGLFQRDVNVVWDLAPHDFAIMNYLISEKPTHVSAFGRSHVNHQEDIAYITIHFASSLLAHFSVNWISPVKIRNILIGGDRRMLVWNDVNADEKVKIYDKGAAIKDREGFRELLVNYRSGDVLVPQISQKEALRDECESFVSCIEKNTIPINDGHAGLEVVRMLETCAQSMKHNGKIVKLNYS